MQVAPNETGILINALYESAEQNGRKLSLGVTGVSFFDSVKTEHDDAGIYLDTLDILEEIGARELQTIFNSPKEFNKWRAKLESDANLKKGWAKVVEYITDLIENIKNFVKQIGMTAEEKAKANELIAKLELYADAYKATINVVEQKNSQKDGEVTESESYNVNVRNSLKSKYNEYHTIGMQWAYSSSTKIGDRKVLFKPRSRRYVLVEATKEDIGFVELSIGTLKQMKGELECYDEQTKRIISETETVDKVLRDSEFGQNNYNGNNVDVRHRKEGKRNVEVSEGKSYSNGTADSKTVDGNITDRTYLKKFSLKHNEANTQTKEQSYTEKEYRNFGWARANNILNAGQNADYRSKFAAAKAGRIKFNKSKSGEYIIPVSDIRYTELEGVDNVLVFAKGTISNPVITSVIEINADNETDLSLIREYIYERERAGIQTEIEELFKRHNSSDRKFKRQKSSSGITHSERFKNGSGSGEENSKVEEKSKVSFSLKAKNTDKTNNLLANIQETEKKKREVMSRFGLTIYEADAVVKYKTAESYKINAKLRNDETQLTEYQKEIVRLLDSALEKLPKHKGKTYRTVSFDDMFNPEEEYNTFIQQHTEGSFLAYKAYTSTSSKIDGHPMPDDTKFGVTLEIEGENGRDVEGFGNNFEK